MSVRSNVKRRVGEETLTEVERKLHFSLSVCTKEKRDFVSIIYLRLDESRFMSVRSNVEGRISEETSTKVELKLPFSLTFISG